MATIVELEAQIAEKQQDIATIKKDDIAPLHVEIDEIRSTITAQRAACSHTDVVVSGEYAQCQNADCMKVFGDYDPPVGG